MLTQCLLGSSGASGRQSGNVCPVTCHEGCFALCATKPVRSPPTGNARQPSACSGSNRFGKKLSNWTSTPRCAPTRRVPQRRSGYCRPWNSHSSPPKRRRLTSLTQRWSPISQRTRPSSAGPSGSERTNRPGTCNRFRHSYNQTTFRSTSCFCRVSRRAQR